MTRTHQSTLGDSVKEKHLKGILPLHSDPVVNEDEQKAKLGAAYGKSSFAYATNRRRCRWVLLGRLSCYPDEWSWISLRVNTPVSKKYLSHLHTIFARSQCYCCGSPIQY